MSYLGTKPANAVITSEQIADGVISTNDLAPGAVTQDKIASSAQYTGFKNRIINGDMRIDQRNAGASVTPANQQYTLDRWVAGLTQTSKFTVQQNAGSVTPPTGFSSYLGITSSSAYSILSSDIFDIQQRIEGFNMADLAWGTANAQSVTLSFQVRSSLTGTFGGSVGNGVRSYPFSYSISSANTWTTISVTIPGDTSGTWATNNTTGMYVTFGLGVGSTYSGTAGAWSSSFYYSATGATSVVGTNGATFYITGVQLEKGSVATSFDYRPYGTELSLCQRYYQQDTRNQISPSSISAGALVRVQWMYPVPMRTSPTLTYNDGNGNAGKIYRSAVNKTGSISGSPTYLLMQSTDTASGNYDDLFFNFFANAEL